MATGTYVRRAYVHAEYEGQDISKLMNKYLVNASFTDVASGESDSLSVTVRDDEHLWMDAWYPQKGDRIQALIKYKNWNKDDDIIDVNMGQYQVDDVTLKGRPTTAMIGELQDRRIMHLQMRTEQRRGKPQPCSRLRSEMAGAAGVPVQYLADDISIASIEQTDQTDCDFLYRLCQSYGLGVKIYEDKIHIFDEEKIETGREAGTYHEDDLLSWNYNTTMAGTYTGAVFSFTDPDTEQDLKVTIGGGDRILNINITADNIQDAERKGIAKLNDTNKKATTLTISTRANPYMVAGLVMEIDGIGKASGKYYAERVVTKISGSGASTQTVTMRKVVPRIKDVYVAAVDEAKSEAATGETYTVKKGIHSGRSQKKN
ncbi:MAG: phage late control D family protein [Roseburia sp.]